MAEDKWYRYGDGPDQRTVSANEFGFTHPGHVNLLRAGKRQRLKGRKDKPEESRRKCDILSSQTLRLPEPAKAREESGRYIERLKE